MWIANLPVGALATKLGLKISSGQWLNAELDKEKEKNTNNIVVYTSGDSNVKVVDKNITYVMVAHGPVSQYRVSEERIKEWKSIIQSENPDIILVWGTEYRIGLCVLKANEHHIPSIVYIQGVMSAIAERYHGSLNEAEIKGITTLFETVFHRGIKSESEYYRRLSHDEYSIISLADGIVVENEWAELQYRRINKSISVYKNRLPIRSEFQRYEWVDRDDNHSIITTTATVPMKGLHILLQAITKVKKQYPDVKLIVPGNNSIHATGLLAKIKQSGYSKYLYSLIVDNKLENNVVFVGPLTAEAYGKTMSESCIFVSASAIENHCSTLREAMTVGVPSIATKVGGIPEYAKDRVNCTLVDYQDVSGFANAIIELFSNRGLRQEYCEAGKQTIFEMYNLNPLEDLDTIYCKVIKNYGGQRK